MLIKSKKGLVRIPAREGHQLIPCCYTDVIMRSACVILSPYLQWRTYVFFFPPLLLRGETLKSIADPFLALMALLISILLTIFVYPPSQPSPGGDFQSGGETLKLAR